MLNVYIIVLILAMLALLSIVLIIKLILKKENQKYKEKCNSSKALYMNKDYITEPINDNDWVLDDITEELLEGNPNDDFIIKKNIIVIHSNITI